MTIEGIPDGWELVAFRRADPGEFFLDNRGLPVEQIKGGAE